MRRRRRGGVDEIKRKVEGVVGVMGRKVGGKMRESKRRRRGREEEELKRGGGGEEDGWMKEDR